MRTIASHGGSSLTRFLSDGISLREAHLATTGTRPRSINGTWDLRQNFTAASAGRAARGEPNRFAGVTRGDGDDRASMGADPPREHLRYLLWNYQDAPTWPASRPPASASGAGGRWLAVQVYAPWPIKALGPPGRSGLSCRAAGPRSCDERVERRRAMSHLRRARQGHHPAGVRGSGRPGGPSVAEPVGRAYRLADPPGPGPLRHCCFTAGLGLMAGAIASVLAVHHRSASTPSRRTRACSVRRPAAGEGRPAVRGPPDRPCRDPDVDDPSESAARWTTRLGLAVRTLRDMLGGRAGLGR